MKAIEIEGLTKKFGALTALDRLSLEVTRGELFALVGPDGAGKTTTMRLLCGILDPTSGDAKVAGCSIRKEPERLKGKIGYMSQRFGLYGDLTVLENLLFYADLFEVSRKALPKKMDRLLGFSNLTPFRDRLAQNLSGGMKQKLGLACALIHTPEILFLDEPTLGVDPISRGKFWQILYELLKEGVTIFVSTAYLDEAERCHRIGLLHRGRIVVQGSSGDLKRNSMPEDVYELDCGEPMAAMEILKGIDGIREIALFGKLLHLVVQRNLLVTEEVKKTLFSKETSIKSFLKVMPSLEDVFVALVKEDDRKRLRNEVSKAG